MYVAVQLAAPYYSTGTSLCYAQIEPPACTGAEPDMYISTAVRLQTDESSNRILRYR
jgi:hypothetical protein